MVTLVQPACATVPLQALADLLWNTDPLLNGYMFGSMAVARKIIASEWPAERGLLCHKQAFTAMEGDVLLGLLIGHTSREYGANFEAAMVLQTAALTEPEAQHLTQALYWMDRLFPTPRDDSYYVLEFSIAPEAQGGGLARHLLDAAEARACASGCRHICLDVAADNEAVGFYQHIGFEVEIETRVPFLHDTHGIGPHLHMVRNLDHRP